jgi:flagellar protein FliT
MLAMATQFDLYQEIASLSAQMVAAARAQNWDQLVALEHTVSGLRENLRKMGEENPERPVIETERKAALIQQILDNDAEVRRHTEPWMEHLRQFLGDTHRKQQLDRAYGSNQF